MADQKKYSVETLVGHKFTRRGLAFLVCANDKNINGKTFFERLKPKREREVRSRFDYWLEGGINNHYFHGWPNNSNYKNCFVFKWKENRQNHRLYGSICNPILNDPGFQFCVLVSHATKNTWETDPNELDEVKELMRKDEVQKVIQKAVVAPN